MSDNAHTFMSFKDISFAIFNWQIVPKTLIKSGYVSEWFACYDFLNNLRTNYPGRIPTHFSSYFMTSFK